MSEKLSIRQKLSGWERKWEKGERERERMDTSLKETPRFRERWKQEEERRKSYGFVHYSIQRTYVST